MNQREFEDAQRKFKAQIDEHIRMTQLEEAKNNFVRQQQETWRARIQGEINAVPRQQYTCIVAVDQMGAFSKDGKIPWSYPDDFKWFQAKTQGGICVMGRTTYEDITNHLGDKAAKSVLPGRRCFVVTSTPLEKDNATAIPSIGALDKILTPDDVGTTVFFCGGEQIYREGIAKCQTLIITVVNKDVEGDRHFPVNYAQEHFTLSQVFKNDPNPDLRFTIWKRKNDL